MKKQEHLDGLFVRGSILEYCQKNGKNIVMLSKFLEEYGELLLRATGGYAADLSVAPETENYVSKTQAMLAGSQCFGEVLKQFWAEYEEFEDKRNDPIE